MNSWEAVRLGDLVRVQRGLSYSSSQITDAGGRPFVTIKCFEKGGGFRYDGLKYFQGVCPDHFRLNGGELLIANTDLTREAEIIGAPLIFPPDAALAGCYSMDVARLYVDPEWADIRYLFHQLQTPAARRFMQALSRGSTVLHLPLKDVGSWDLKLPPIPEQRRIAQILDTVDEAIQRTEQVIEKLKLVKQGLLYDLLTRGIDENGGLRDPERHPEQFKDSVLGRIPREWDIVQLSTLTAHITKGATPTTFGYEWGADSGVLFLRSECVREGSFSLEGSDHIPPEAHRAMSRSVIHGGDILMTITGYIGRSCLYPVDMPEANINQHIARIRVVRDDLTHPRWVMWALQDPRQTRLLERDLTGLAYPQISLAQVQAIPVPVPPQREQEKIFSLMDAEEYRLSSERRLLAKLRLLKRGLMDDLLTGRVRVQVPDEAT